MIITPLPDDAPKSAVKEKIKEIIDFLNAANLKPKPTPPIEPASWSNSNGKQELGKWRLNTNNAAFATNREGVDILIRKMTFEEQHEFEEDQGEPVPMPPEPEVVVE